MPLWGTKDTVYSTGKVNVSAAGVVTKQSGSIAWTSGNGVKVGQVVTIATDGAGPGQGVIASIDSATQLTLSNLENISASSTFSDVDYEIRETPVYEVGTGRFAINEIYGVDTAEIEETRDDNSQYHPAHAGWVGITTYNNDDGTLRVKTEVLVAGSSISGDSGDDTVLPDS
tara:strand:- start:34 stop:549 length:516 start_codon:yes stop_codon:yes gene_type:complete